MTHCICNNGERTQSQKIHLEQAECLHIILVELRNERPLRDPDGHLARKRLLRNHDTGRMNGDIARQPLDPPRKVDHPANTLVLVIETTEVRRLFEGALQRDV